MEAVNLLDLLDSIGMIEEDTGVTHSLFQVALLILDCVCTTKQVSLLMILLHVLPVLARVDCLSGLSGSKMELLRASASQVDHGLNQHTSIEHLIGTVELGISLLHEGYPELIEVGAVTVERGLAL